MSIIENAKIVPLALQSINSRVANTALSIGDHEYTLQIIDGEFIFTTPDGKRATLKNIRDIRFGLGILKGITNIRNNPSISIADRSYYALSCDAIPEIDDHETRITTLENKPDSDEDLTALEARVQTLESESNPFIYTMFKQNNTNVLNVAWSGHTIQYAAMMLTIFRINSTSYPALELNRSTGNLILWGNVTMDARVILPFSFSNILGRAWPAIPMILLTGRTSMGKTIDFHTSSNQNVEHDGQFVATGNQVVEFRGKEFNIVTTTSTKVVGGNEVATTPFSVISDENPIMQLYNNGDLSITGEFYAPTSVMRGYGDKPGSITIGYSSQDAFALSVQQDIPSYSPSVIGICGISNAGGFVTTNEGYGFLNDLLYQPGLTLVRGGVGGGNFWKLSSLPTITQLTFYCNFDPVSYITTDGSYVKLSDQKYKDHIEDLDHENIYNAVMEFRPVTYYHKSNHTTNKSYGFIAQEIEVLTDKHNIDPITEIIGDNYTMKYEDITPMLVSVVQQQNKRISQLELQYQELSQRFDQLFAAYNLEHSKPPLESEQYSLHNNE